MHSQPPTPASWLSPPSSDFLSLVGTRPKKTPLYLDGQTSALLLGNMYQWASKLCVCVVCIHVCVKVCVHTCAHRPQVDPVSTFLCYCLPQVVRQGLSLNVELTDMARHLGSSPQGGCLLSLPLKHWDYRWVPNSFLFYFYGTFSKDQIIYHHEKNNQNVTSHQENSR